MRTLAALLVALPLAAAAQPAPPPEAPPATWGAPPAQPPPYPPVYAPIAPLRDSWYIGLGLGGGVGRARDDLGSFKLSDGMTDPITVLVNFKVGATLTPSLLAGLDISGLRTAGTDSGGTVDVAFQITNYDAMVTWFPMERGLFLRGGVGVSRFTSELTGYATANFTGVNATVGGGYALWLGRSFNLTLNLDFSGQSYNSSTGPSSSSYTALWVGFDWY